MLEFGEFSIFFSLKHMTRLDLNKQTNKQKKINVENKEKTYIWKQLRAVFPSLSILHLLLSSLHPTFPTQDTHFKVTTKFGHLWGHF